MLYFCNKQLLLSKLICGIIIAYKVFTYRILIISTLTWCNRYTIRPRINTRLEDLSIIACIHNYDDSTLVIKVKDKINVLISETIDNFDSDPILCSEKT